MISLSPSHPQFTLGQQQFSLGRHQPIKPVSQAVDSVHFSGKQSSRTKKVVLSSLSGLAFAIGAPVSYAEMTAQVSPTRYVVLPRVFANTEDLHIDFSKLDLALENSPLQEILQSMAKEMKQSNIKRQKIDLEFATVMSGADIFSIGGLKLNLKGTLSIEGNYWRLSNGELTGLPDLMDYENSTHRNFLAEVVTRAFGTATFWGKPYRLIFEGSQSYQAEGRLALK